MSEGALVITVNKIMIHRSYRLMARPFGQYLYSLLIISLKLELTKCNKWNGTTALNGMEPLHQMEWSHYTEWNETTPLNGMKPLY